MKESTELTYQACKGIRPYRTPIYDLLTNDAVIEHFGGYPLDGTQDQQTAIRAAAYALDCTRYVNPPNKTGDTFTDGLGNVWVMDRWTGWIQHHALTSVEDWKKQITKVIEQTENQSFPTPKECAHVAAEQRVLIDKLDGTAFIHCTPSTAINSALFGGCGLEIFSYLWADERELTLRWMRALELGRSMYIETAAHADNCQLAVIYSDVAYKQRLMFSREMFQEMGFFDDVAGICDQCHKKGLTVIFHSDGYIMDIMSDLIAAGIDGVNPIEIAAGMDVYELRKLYPNLILAGGLDVTHLLPFGTPDEVRKETRRMINEVGSEGRLLIGSSTELENNVPLENYLAFHDEAMRG